MEALAGALEVITSRIPGASLSIAEIVTGSTSMTNAVEHEKSQGR
jgi:hypothetical protein